MGLSGFLPRFWQQVDRGWSYRNGLPLTQIPLYAGLVGPLSSNPDVPLPFLRFFCQMDVNSITHATATVNAAYLYNLIMDKSYQCDVMPQIHYFHQERSSTTRGNGGRRRLRNYRIQGVHRGQRFFLLEITT